MKKIFIASLLTLTIVTTSAQDFRIGLKGIFNSTWLFNNNISDRGADADYLASFGYTSGITSALYFTENLGVSVDLFYAWHYQLLDGILSTEDAYTSVTLVKYLDVPVLFRVSSEGGPYIEIGPQVSFLAGAEEIYEFSSSTGPGSSLTKNFKDDFNSLTLAAVLGFGYDIEASDKILINVGLRFGFGLSDATKEYTEEQFDDADHGRISRYAHQSPITNGYEYHKTTRAFGGLSVGVIYRPNN